MKQWICSLILFILCCPAPLWADFDFDDLDEVMEVEQTSLLELARQQAKSHNFSQAETYLNQARQKAYDPDAVKSVENLIAENRRVYEAEQERKQQEEERKQREEKERRLAEERRQRQETEASVSRDASGNMGGSLNCSYVSKDYGLWSYCDSGDCSGLSSNYGLWQLCESNNPDGLSANYGVWNYLKTGDASGLSGNYNAWRGAQKNAGSFADRKRFIIFYLRGYLYGHMN